VGRNGLRAVVSLLAGLGVAGLLADPGSPSGAYPESYPVATATASGYPSSAARKVYLASALRNVGFSGAVAYPVATATTAPQATATSVPTATPARCLDVQWLLNPSFESGGSPWSITHATPERPTLSNLHSSHGSWSFYTGGRNNLYQRTIQTVTAPNNATSASLWFNKKMFSLDITTVAVDFLVVGVLDQNGSAINYAALSNTGNRGGWVTYKVPITNLAAHLGRQMDVVIAAETDASLTSWWYVDEVYLVFDCASTDARPAADAPAGDTPMDRADAQARLTGKGRQASAAVTPAPGPH